MKPHEGLNFLTASSKKNHPWLSIEYNRPSLTNTEWIGTWIESSDARCKKRKEKKTLVY
jgi:hypothetical protein